MTKQKQKRPTHNWAVDHDYWDKLSKEEKEWLRQFDKEYYYASFNNKEKSLHPDYLKPDCRKRNKSMWRDAMTNALPLDEETTPLQDLEDSHG